MDAFDPATVFSSIDHAAATRTATSRNARRGTSPGWPRRCCRCSPRTRTRRSRSRRRCARSRPLPPPLERRHAVQARARGGRRRHRRPRRRPADAAARARVDYTSAFRTLSASLRGDAVPAPLQAWATRWREQLAHGGADPRDRGGDGPRQPGLHPAQPPRRGGARGGHRGDLGPFQRLLDVVAAPYTRAPAWTNHRSGPAGRAPVPHATAAPDGAPRGHRLTLRAARPPPHEPARRIGRGSHGRGGYAPEAVAATPDRSGYPSAGSGPPARA